MTKKEIEMYDFIVEIGIATPEELNLARNLVSGSWENVINAVIYIRTRYSDFESLLEAMAEEE